MIGSAVLLFFATPLQGQDCVTLQAIPPTASLTVVGTITKSSRSPMNLCSLNLGETYTLFVRAYGFENRRLKFRLSTKDDKLRFSGDRLPYLARSLVVPGWGQYGAGHSGGFSAWTFTLTATSAVYAGLAYLDYRDRKDEYDALREQAALATTQADIERLGEASVRKLKEANTLEDYAVDATILVGWIYAWNLLETFLVSAPPRVASVEGSTVTVETPERSKARATFRSIFFPGMGQIYLGNHVKGTIIQTGFIAAAVWAIEARKQYSLADDRHVLARADLERASTVGDIESAQREARAALSTRDDKEAIRDAAFVALGSVWLLNVIDVAFAKGSSLSSRRFAFETLYQDSVLRTGMSFRF